MKIRHLLKITTEKSKHGLPPRSYARFVSGHSNVSPWLILEKSVGSNAKVAIVDDLFRITQD